PDDQRPPTSVFWPWHAAFLVVVMTAGPRRSEDPPSCCRWCLRAPGLGVLAAGVLGIVSSATLHVAEQTHLVALQAGAVVALEHAQFVDLALEQGPLTFQLAQGPIALLIGLAGHALPFGAGLGDEPVGFGLAVADVLVVQALGQLQHAGRRGGLIAAGGAGLLGARRLFGGGGLLGLGGLLALVGGGLFGRAGVLLAGHRAELCGLFGRGLGRVLRFRCAAGGQLGHALFGGLELGLQLLVLGPDHPQGVDDLVEEVIHLVLVIPLPELGGLELLVEDVVCGQQSHGRHLGLDRSGQEQCVTDTGLLRTSTLLDFTRTVADLVGRRLTQRRNCPEFPAGSSTAPARSERPRPGPPPRSAPAESADARPSAAGR